ncbi:MAG: Gfo/Idh/MocA family oxidoreductase [Lutibacter sp.]|jgi:predicted dehydrogenase|nr:Gfo/Idh/MocA family oxidoreductase [Lutibacter sp.]
MGKKIKLGIIGGGGDSLIGVLHRVASFTNDNFEIVGGVFNPNWEENIGFAATIGLGTDRIYKDFDTFISQECALPAAERIEVVSVLTPNFLHFPMAKKLLENGFHVICEKPLTTSLEEAYILQDIAQKTKAVFAVTYTYTGYPMVRQMREMIREGAIGTIQKVDIQYYQGWINPVIHDSEKRKAVWRLDPSKAGISCCMGDIGTHAFNMAEYLTGLEVNSLLAALNTLYEDNSLDIDGTVLLRFSNQVRGLIRTSQIATGEENAFQVKIYGTKGGLLWEQEQPNAVTLLSEGKPLQVYTPGHPYNSELSLKGTKLPPGHPEGIFDAMANIYLGVAQAVRKEPYDAGEFPPIRDGVRGMQFVAQCVASDKAGNQWVDL